ncbi:unnamed protein product, partial [Mesorhabditis belari]|uniref:Uncharacterized protein n=1 Tax=Mesorhabditis belari TaxID=2138241 RepID=A0AAF3EGL5_9BILA
MLSLLSLLIASGTVLRPDTETWTPTTYPNPRINATLCNTKENSTVCDPDHLLADQWRSTIDETVRTQVEKLRNTKIQYIDDAPEDCSNGTDPFQMYVLLARKINGTTNSTVTTEELKIFGDGLVEHLGLNNQSCKNFLVLIVVETANSAYARTGRHMKMPADLMEQAFNSSKNVFNEKNYMEILNQIVERIGDSLVQTFEPPTEPPSVETSPETTSESIEISTLGESTESNYHLTEPSDGKGGNVLFYIFMMFLVVLILCIMVTVALIRHRQIRIGCSEMKTPHSHQFTEYTSAYSHHSPSSLIIRDTVTIPQLQLNLEDDLDTRSSICGKTSLTPTTLSTDAALPKSEPPIDERKTL